MWIYVIPEALTPLLKQTGIENVLNKENLMFTDIQTIEAFSLAFQCKHPCGKLFQVKGLASETDIDSAWSNLETEVNAYSATCINDSVILYAEPSASGNSNSLVETILNAMAMIMPVDAVFKTELFEHYVQGL